MAGQRLTDKTALEEQAGSGDLLMLVDVSDSSGSAAGTSKKTDFKYVIQTDKISLSNADVLDLNANEKTLIGALSGYMVTPISVTALCTYASATENQRKQLLFGFDDADDAVFWSKVDNCMDGITTNVTYHLGAGESDKYGSCTISTINKPFICWAQGTGFTGGWSCDIYVTYCYTKVL